MKTKRFLVFAIIFFVLAVIFLLNVILVPWDGEYTVDPVPLEYHEGTITDIHYLKTHGGKITAVAIELQEIDPFLHVQAYAIAKNADISELKAGDKIQYGIEVGKPTSDVQVIFVDTLSCGEKEYVTIESHKEGMDDAVFPAKIVNVVFDGIFWICSGLFFALHFRKRNRKNVQ